jgi:hypothetical protein
MVNNAEMTTTNAANTLDSTIQSWGYNSVEAFAREHAKNILQQKMSYYQSQINYFEEKYGMSFELFSSEFAKIKNHSIIEKEDDSIHWETAIDVFQSYQKEFSTLDKC